MRTRFALLVGMVGMVTTATASAEPSVNVESPSADLAREHYKRGAVLYEATRYDAALHEFEAAQATDPRPPLLYNIARCLEQLGRRAESLAAYERYLREDPTAANAAEVTAKIAALTAALTAALAPPALPPAVTVAALRPIRQHRYLIPGVVAGGALALAVAGAGLLGSALGEYRSLDASCSPNCSQGAWSQLPAREHAGEALLGVAGAAVVADIVLFVLESKRGR